ncbi:MAG: hypothetical protein P0S96_00880 [Simkaniaceae bacterium]|nr:hypothetical protein [Candidatus Sacchlamyda saccharinae]
MITISANSINPLEEGFVFINPTAGEIADEFEELVPSAPASPPPASPETPEERPVEQKHRAPSFIATKTVLTNYPSEAKLQEDEKIGKLFRLIIRHADNLQSYSKASLLHVRAEAGKCITQGNREQVIRFVQQINSALKSAK